MRAKLAREPVEDLRVDSEDGYRGPPDREDDDVARAAAVLAAEPTLPPFWGTRAKSLEGPTRRRGVRSLDLFLGGLAGRGRAVVTLPKVTAVEQVAAFLPVLDALEQAHGLALDLELQVETPQAVLGADGAATLAAMLHAGGGRVTGLHYGTYDYSASLGIAAAHQASDHPAADHAKATMQVAVAGTGARAVDGSTNVLPVGDTAAVHAAWVLHAGLVRRALERGFYQGWDLHPAQLVTRYTATYAFFRAALPAGGVAAGGLRVPGGRRGARRAGHGPGAGVGGAARGRLRCAGRRGGRRRHRAGARGPRPAGRPGRGCRRRVRPADRRTRRGPGVTPLAQRAAADAP